MSGRKTRNTLSSQDQELMILAAAELEFTEAGVRKANIDTVAARAGVSRSTLYRRFANKEELLLAVAQHVYDRVMRELDTAVAGLSPQDAVVEAFVAGARIIEQDNLVRRLLVDGDVKVLTAQMPALFIELAIARVASTLRRAGARMPDADLHDVVEIHVRLVMSFMEVPPSDTGRWAPAKVRDTVGRFIAPMVW
ncbi:TetR family transcriptional regulator [Gordonia pseudamarae]|jgi:TetR/AcrR family transcriptional regulator|uniref:TetR family transcriptional regulator n=1 Tax=Gordonia pseudamarae TaxID=2831662 RepID=A0ABX6IMP5_9ACTN|nr:MULTISPECIES: TetR/AcrR family transcriptional regulator [Gordonia]MBD0021131.1 TetR/AcrR family transcriptional regulator [Gordonia sp. (in: high G+C Gram-positive bacteria)]QHN27503.1 TetR family transcriptional regulator [Gordonia pseudamarae]QHN36386.1 TetR family transcriptional regulator [Gordonia pseudamarae]